MPNKTHVVLPGSRRAKDPKAIRIGDVDPNEKIDVTIGLSGPKLPDADEYVGKTLTPTDLADRFGAKQEDANKVANTLKKYGLKVDELRLGTRSMRVSGSIANMEAAFKTNLALMRSDRQGEYRGRAGTLQVPIELEGLVTGVFGLDERRMAERKLRKRNSTDAAANGLSPLAPEDIEQRYNFPPGDGEGQNIAIAEFGGGFFAEDLAAFCDKFQRPIPNVQPISVDAPAFTLQDILALPPVRRKEELDNSVEVMMDVQIIAGLCPKSQICVYFSTFDQQGWIDLLDKVIAAKPVTLSVSWGLAEDDPGWSSNAVSAIDDRLNMARLLGITTCVSSGDDGSGDEILDNRAHVDFPGSSPHVLGVGGTMLTLSGGAAKEVTWWESPGWRTPNGGGASGGGVSSVLPRPAWQTVQIPSLNRYSIDGRVVPDVSALAGAPLYDLVFAGKSNPNGGTSASAPLWAALIARINAQLPLVQQQRFLTPLLYRTDANGVAVGKSSTRDVTVGDNTSTPEPGVGYQAGPGFDAVTGWGVPDGVKLLNSLVAI